MKFWALGKDCLVSLHRIGGGYKGSFQMTRSLFSTTTFRATTALTLSLSLLQPTVAVGQAVGNGQTADDANGQGRVQFCMANPDGENCEETLRDLELCIEDPAIEGCDALLNEQSATEAGAAGATETEAGAEGAATAQEPGTPDIPTETPPEVPPVPTPEPETPPSPDIPQPDVPEIPQPTPEAPEPPAPGPEIPPPTTEAGPGPEATQAPQGAPDAEGAPDAATPDAAAPGGAAPEPATPDETAPDAAAPDAEAPDAAAPDAAAPDAAAPADAGPDAPAAGDAAPQAPAATGDAAPDSAGAPAADPAQGEGAAPVTPAPADGAQAPAATQAQPDQAAEDLQNLPEGTEAPEVTEGPAEVVENTPEPTPELTAEDEARIQRLLEDPEVAGAVETLNRALGLQADTPAEPAADTDAAAEGQGAPATALGAAAAAALAVLGQQQGEQADQAAEAPAPEDVVEQQVTEENSRSSTEDFDTRIVTSPQQEQERRGLSRLEQAGLLALGAVGVGMLVGNNRVVANSGDRVVVDRGQGDLAIWKDDNALIRQPGNTERTERYADGSTRTILERTDGSSIITVRDATGRVLWRERREPDGTSVQLIDDLRPVEPVDVTVLPPPQIGEVRVTERTDTAMLRSLLAEAEAQDLGRTFTLRQVRETRELRELAPEITTEPITFETASSVVRNTEARKLVQIGRLMQEMIAENPREIFLIEGHTDAVGSASYNLALSDRRAESVALALTEYFGVPPENMVVQGYGERFLKVATQEAEPANRRVAVRRITWLIN